MQTLDIAELKAVMAAELEKRRCSGHPFSYAAGRGGPEALYGLTGAVNVLEAIGRLPADASLRRRAAARILGWRRADGFFDGGSGPGHAAHMIIGAINMLGQPVPADIGPLAPLDPARLPGWLARHDWQSTHKELCGQTIPLLAGERVGAEWRAVFSGEIAARLDPARPLETWCAAATPACFVISCIFHVLSAFDAGRLPYPRPAMLAARLFDLNWEAAPDSEKRTFCTDGDWALLLLALARQEPSLAGRALSAVHLVSARRVRDWYRQREAILEASTHDLYCYLWSTAVFQDCVREHYPGGYLRDTFNDPALFRV